MNLKACRERTHCGSISALHCNNIQEWSYWDIKVERNGIPNEFMISHCADASLVHSVILVHVKSSCLSLGHKSADIGPPFAPCGVRMYDVWILYLGTIKVCRP